MVETLQLNNPVGIKKLFVEPVISVPSKERNRANA